MSLVVPPYPEPRYRKDRRRHRAGRRRGPGPHFHRAMSEAFFVLSGTMKLYDGSKGGEWIDGHPRDFLYAPPGGIHGFRNEADEPASILMLFAPGAPREAYFEGFGALADMTDDERREWFIRHDNFFV
jgi:mannose-6-phosphate isomerase-like protein (cupin superfamily)